MRFELAVLFHLCDTCLVSFELLTQLSKLLALLLVLLVKGNQSRQKPFNMPFGGSKVRNITSELSMAAANAYSHASQQCITTSLSVRNTSKRNIKR